MKDCLTDYPICERCGKPITEKFGSGRFCSRSCANTRQHSSETKEKIRRSLTKNIELLKCTCCGKILNSRNKSGFCNKCYPHQSPSEESKLKQSNTMKAKCYPRWNIHRNSMSYAEKFFSSVLDSYKISYDFEKPVLNNKHHFYYLDFYIEKNSIKIDLEIDGKQHLERAEHDKVRDEFLKEQGYIVYRIAWHNINSSSGKALMQTKIDDFIAFYNNL